MRISEPAMAGRDGGWRGVAPAGPAQVDERCTTRGALPVAYVWVSRCYHTGKPKHISWQGRLPGGPWPHAGRGRVFNHAPRTRRAAKSSYSQTKPFAVIITAVAPKAAGGAPTGHNSCACS